MACSGPTELNETKIEGIPERMQWAGENGFMSSILWGLCLTYSFQFVENWLDGLAQRVVLSGTKSIWQ